MDSKLYELIARLFSDSMNIQILCSIYENEVTADTIAALLDLDKKDVAKRLEMLRKQSLVWRKQRGSNIVYSLINPKVCDSILMLRDSMEHRQLNKLSEVIYEKIN